MRDFKVAVEPDHTMGLARRLIRAAAVCLEASQRPQASTDWAAAAHPFCRPENGLRLKLVRGRKTAVCGAQKQADFYPLTPLKSAYKSTY
jgi:hypothetical protein